MDRGGQPGLSTKTKTTTTSTPSLPRATPWIKTQTGQRKGGSERQSKLFPHTRPMGYTMSRPLQTSPLSKRARTTEDGNAVEQAFSPEKELEPTLRNSVVPDSQGAIDNMVTFDLTSEISSPTVLLKSGATVSPRRPLLDESESEFSLEEGGPTDYLLDDLDLPCTESALRSTQTQNQNGPESLVRPVGGQPFDTLSPLSGWNPDNSSLLDYCRMVCGIPDGSRRTREEIKAQRKLEGNLLNQKSKADMLPSYVPGADDLDSWSALIKDRQPESKVASVGEDLPVLATPTVTTTTPFYRILTSRRSPTPPATKVDPIYVKVKTPPRIINLSSDRSIPSSRTPKALYFSKEAGVEGRSPPVSPSPLCRTSTFEPRPVTRM